MATQILPYVFNHELLALGLEHTFDDSDGDFYISTDPYLSATPEETVMSYRPPSLGVYPSDLSASDYNALVHIWGANEDTLLSTTSVQPVYRLYNLASGKHLFTTNQTEIDILTGNTAESLFINEGIAYTVSEGAHQDLYRFYNLSSNRHFYSKMTSRDQLISDPQSGFIYEGIAFQVFTDPCWYQTFCLHLYSDFLIRIITSIFILLIRKSLL